MYEQESEMTEYSVAEYEDGWFVERPDRRARLESCKFVQVAGPFKTEAEAAAQIPILESTRAMVMSRDGLRVIGNESP
jgi:hypothetical protein